LDDTCRNGESTPGPEGSGDGDEDPSHVYSVFSSGSFEAREECTCGFCDGVEVEYSEIDAHSGEVKDRSFKKASQKERCPRCGGYNLNWRQRFIAHCASVGKRLGRKRRAFFVSFVLIRSAAEEAGLGTEESYEVLKNLWDRARRGMKRRAGEVDYSGVLATRPSDDRYHGHVLVYASLTRYELMRAFHVRGLDTYIETSDDTAATTGNDGGGPDAEGSPGGNDRDNWDARARFGMPKDDGMNAESFAAKKGAYIWENAAASKKSRYTSSRGNGAGYNSKEARRRRREAVNGQNDGNGDGDSTSGGDGEPSPGDPSPSLNRNGRGGGGDGGQGSGGSEGGNPDPNRGSGRSRAPPVDCGGGRFLDLDAALAAAKSAFTRRVGTKVPVVNEGTAKLLKVYREGDSLACVIASGGHSTTERVPWNQVEVVNSPKTRPGSSDPTDRSNDRGGSDSGGDGGSSDSGSKGGSTPSDNGDGGSDGDGSAPDGDGPDEDKDDPDGDDGGGENGSSGDDGDSGGDDGDRSKDDDSENDEDPGERFQEAADKSVVQMELPSQDRLKTVFNYETGKARASVLPPRHSTSA
jgi:hypothetical protein